MLDQHNLPEGVERLGVHPLKTSGWQVITRRPHEPLDDEDMVRIRDLPAIRAAAEQRYREALEEVWALLDKIVDPLKGQPSRMHSDQTTDAELARAARGKVRAALKKETP